jgi:hypothetical protein
MGSTESTSAAVESGAYEHGLSTQLPNTSFPKFSIEVHKWHRYGNWQHKWATQVLNYEALDGGVISFSRIILPT